MKRTIIMIGCAYLSLIATPSFAGPGHDHGEGAFANNAAPATHFELNERQMKNLGIQSASSEFLPMQQSVGLLAFTELLPEKKATISPRFNGKILTIHVQVGQVIKKGQTVTTLQPANITSKPVTFTSPIDGYVLSLDAGLGDVLNAGETIMTLGNPDQMLIRGVAYETPDINKLKVGQRAEIHLDIAPNHHIHGKIQRINRVIDPDSRTFSVFALIDTPEGDIQPGLQGTMEIFTGDNTPSMAIPKSAVLGELGSYFVYVIKGREVEKRNISVGTKSGEHIEVKSGLFPNERVVTRGNYQLQYISVGGIHEHDHNSHDHSEEHNHDDDDHKHDH